MSAGFVTCGYVVSRGEAGESEGGENGPHSSAMAGLVPAIEQDATSSR